jgi:hypothetical protein
MTEFNGRGIGRASNLIDAVKFSFAARNHLVGDGLCGKSLDR